MASKNILPPHVLFALDNIIRRIAEYLVGLIRPGLLLSLSLHRYYRLLFSLLDFRPAEHSMVPLTPNHDSQSRLSSSNGVEELINDEIIKLHEQYKIVAQKSREYENNCFGKCIDFIGNFFPLDNSVD